MKHLIQFEDNLPHSFCIKGLYYKETHALSLQSLALFLERDIQVFLKNFKSEQATFDLSLIQSGAKKILIITVSILHQSAQEIIQEGIQNILGGYNHQRFIFEQGQFKPLPPRFTYQINMSFVENFASAYEEVLYV